LPPDSQPTDTHPAGGLRERKKARTRAAIQHEALRLFRDHGYGATTVEQIADAAEVAVSTLFRYFPAKEDLVLSDEYDPLIIEAFRGQRADLRPVEALRGALRSVMGGLSAAEAADMRERANLAVGIPELRAAMVDQLAQTMRQLTGLIAERAGRDADDFAVHTLAGAMIGVMISAEFYWIEHPGTDLFALLDDALAELGALDL
jgi:AcrR family transcriptional regulator